LQAATAGLEFSSAAAGAGAIARRCWGRRHAHKTTGTGILAIAADGTPLARILGTVPAQVPLLWLQPHSSS
jgi:hypothetical protein